MNGDGEFDPVFQKIFLVNSPTLVVQGDFTIVQESKDSDPMSPPNTPKAPEISGVRIYRSTGWRIMYPAERNLTVYTNEPKFSHILSNESVTSGLSISPHILSSAYQIPVGDSEWTIVPPSLRNSRPWKLFVNNEAYLSARWSDARWDNGSVFTASSWVHTTNDTWFAKDIDSIRGLR